MQHPKQTNSKLETIENFFNANSNKVAKEEADTKSFQEREFLFGISLENFGIENLEGWLKYEEQQSTIWINHEEFRLKKANSDSERTLREKNARLAFRFAACWATFIAIFIILHGFKQCFGVSFKLEQSEFIFVCGTLTASVLIFYLTVIKNLFPNK